MVHLSIHLCHLPFLLSESKSSEYRSFASLGRFIPRHFILFAVMANIYLWYFILGYMNEAYICILTLYPATLLNSLMSSSSFLVVSLEFSMYSIMPIANGSFNSSFPICIPLVFFTSLIAVTRTSKTMLNKSSESRPFVCCWS